MKKLCAALILSISLTSGATAHATETKPPLRYACKYRFDDGRDGWSVTEVRRTIQCAVHRWPVPGGVQTALSIAWRESQFNQFALNPSGCAGIYQWAPSTWSSVLGDFPPLHDVLGHNVMNARSNVLYAIKFAHNRGWGPWN